ncbi:hypothetical protein HAX54_013156, partial [Datura stramonium]|nr:hypothetical protein [Datura stramonium]
SSGSVVSVAECSINRERFLVTRLGDIRSENADMSNKKSCEKHNRLPVEGFLCSANLRRVNRSLRNPRKGYRPMGTHAHEAPAEREGLPGRMPMRAGFFEKARADSETWDHGLVMNEGKLFELSLPAAYVV